MAERLRWADSLKRCLMLLVVTGHSIQAVLGDGCFEDHAWNLIYSFHMPAFMSVSGWLSYRPDSKASVGVGRYVVRRARQLLVPYLLWSLLILVFRRDVSVQGLAAVFQHPDLFFWFLWALFFICLVFQLTVWLSQRLHVSVTAASVICGLLLMALMVAGDLHVFGFRYIAYYFLFYVLGYVLHRHPLHIRSKGVLAVLVLVWGVLAWFWNMHSLPGWFPAVPHIPASLLLYAYRGLTATVAIVLLVNLFPRLPGHSDRAVWMGRHSLGVYTAHITFIEVVTMTAGLAWMPRMPALCELLLFATALAFSVIVVWLLTRNRKTTGLLLGIISSS